MIMYWIWQFIGQIQTENVIIKPIIGLLSAYGTYKTVYISIGLIINLSNYLKKVILGKYYLDGVWIGVYLGVANKPIYYIENYCQDFEKVIVKGRCYTSDYSYKGSWDSENVILNIDNNKLRYTYSTDMINNNFVNIGQSDFNIIREDNKGYASKLIGYSKDLFSNKKFKSIEIKYCDGHSTGIKRDESDEELLKKCFELYESHRAFFNNQEEVDE